jgi:hypothetical protein
MADGLLGGFGDFLTGGGVYADPKAINPTYGVPEGDVRQAAINQLGQMSALLLAAGQPMEGSQRAQLLSQIGGTGNQFNTNLYNAAQRRLMTAQMAEKQDEALKIQAMSQKIKDDPEGLQKSLASNGVTVPLEFIKTAPTKSLVDLVSQITLKRATVEPTQAFLTGGAAGAAPQTAGVPAPAGAATSGAPAPAGAAQPQEAFTVPDAFLQSLDPQTRAKVDYYTQGINRASVAGNIKSAGEIADTLYKVVPGLKEAQVETAKTKASEIAGAPNAYSTAVQTLKNIDAAIAHPGREEATGVSGIAMRNLPATNARDFANRASQLGGAAFREAYESLKGGGAISQTEGEKATQSVARLQDLNVKDEAYLQALKEYRDIIENSAKKALQKMGGKLPEGYEAIPQSPYATGKPAAKPQQRSFTGGARVISVE